MGHYRQRTMIVAVIAVRMVQASVDQVIDVVPMRNRLMTTVRTVAMRLIMTRSTMFWIAPIRIGAADFNHVFISAPLFHVLQMAMVEIIDVIFMLNGNMAAAYTMHMRLIGGGHGASFLSAGYPLQGKDRQRFRRDCGRSEPPTGHLDAPRNLVPKEPNSSHGVRTAVASATAAVRNRRHRRRRRLTPRHRAVVRVRRSAVAHRRGDRRRRGGVARRDGKDHGRYGSRHRNRQL